MSHLNNDQQEAFYKACKDGNVEIVNTIISQQTIDINKTTTDYDQTTHVAFNLIASLSFDCGNGQELDSIKQWLSGQRDGLTRAERHRLNISNLSRQKNYWNDIVPGGGVLAGQKFSLDTISIIQNEETQKKLKKIVWDYQIRGNYSEVVDGAELEFEFFLFISTTNIREHASIGSCPNDKIWSFGYIDWHYLKAPENHEMAKHLGESSGIEILLGFANLVNDIDGGKVKLYSFDTIGTCVFNPYSTLGHDSYRFSITNNSVFTGNSCGNIGDETNFENKMIGSVVSERLDKNDCATALYMACYEGHVEIVNALLNQESIDINKGTTNSGITPLCVACQEGHVEIVNALLNQESIDINKALTDDGMTPLYVACQEGHVEIVNALLNQESIDINKGRTDDGRTPLYVACEEGHAEIVNTLLNQESIEINKGTTDDGRTPLYAACHQGHVEIVNALFNQESIDINKGTTDDGTTPLYIACNQGHVEIVNALLNQESIDINKGTTDDGITPLYIACHQGHVETVNTLLNQESIDINKGTTDYGTTPFYIACGNGHVEIVNTLLNQESIDINKGTTNSGMTPLYIACQEGHVEIVNTLLNQESTEINKAPTDDGMTPLYIACQEGHVALVNALLNQASIDINKARRDDGRTPLYIACQQGHVEIVNVLLNQESIDINKAETDYGMTPLYIACDQGHVEIVNALLNQESIDINKAETNNGATPLYIACFKGHVEIVNALLNHESIDINKATTNNGTTPLYIACNQGHVEIVNALLNQESIDINKARRDDGATPLYIACQEGHVEIVNALLNQESIDINKAATDYGATPLYIACQNGHVEIVNALLNQESTEINKAPTDYGMTPLYIACQEGHVELVNALLNQESIEINKGTPDNGMAPLYIACQEGHVEIVNALLNQESIDINKGTTNNGTTPLYIACFKGHVEIVNALLKQQSIDINKGRINDGMTPLCVACQEGHVELINALLNQESIEINKGTPDNGMAPLYIACQEGHVEIVNALLNQESIDINKGTTNNGTTPLYIACFKGHVEIVNALLKQQSIDINKGRINDGMTPLCVACGYGHVEIVNALLNQESIEINKGRINDGMTPLYIACGKGHVEIVNALLNQESIDINKARRDDGRTPLYIACAKGHVEIVNTLLNQESIEINKALTNDGRTPLYIACQEGHVEIVNALLNQESIEINNGTPDNGMTPLYIACFKGHVEIVNALLNQESIDINKARRDDGMTPLYIACQEGHVEIINALLNQESIDINKATKNKFGQMIFYSACFGGHIDLVNVLLNQESIDINKGATDDGQTPLHIACQNGHIDVVGALLSKSKKKQFSFSNMFRSKQRPEQAIDINKLTLNNDGTSLYIACQEGHVEIVNALLDQELIDLNKGTIDNNRTPFLAACSAGHVKIVNALLNQESIDINKATTDDGQTPLYVACEEGHVDTVKALLNQKSIDINEAATDDGQTPLYVACEKGHVKIVKALLNQESVDINKATTDVGATPFLIASQSGHIEIMKILKEKSAKISIPLVSGENSGATPFWAASYGGNCDAVKLLASWNVDYSKPTDDGRSPKDIANDKGYNDIVKYIDTIEVDETNKPLIEQKHVVRNSKQGLTPFAAYQISRPKTSDNVLLLLSTGSITKYSGDCIVNTTNNNSSGAGVDSEVGRKGGEALRNARMKHNHIETGDALLTISGELPCKYCIHTVGPHYNDGTNDNKADKLLQQAYESTFREVRMKKDEIKTIAFPIISSGAAKGNKSMEYVAKVGIRSLVENVRQIDMKIDCIHLIVYKEEDKTAVTNIANKFFKNIAQNENNDNKNKMEKKKQLYAEQLLKQALANDGGQPWNRSKLMLVGEGRAGKTCILRSLMGKPFRRDEESTIGAETDECVVDTIDIKTADDNDKLTTWRELTAEEKISSEFDRMVAKLISEGLSKDESVKKAKATIRKAKVTQQKKPIVAGNKLKKKHEEQKSVTNIKATKPTTKAKKEQAKSTPRQKFIKNPSTKKKNNNTMKKNDNNVKKKSEEKQIDMKKKAQQKANQEMKRMKLHGNIDIKSMMKNIDQRLRIGCWDFGGQEIFYTVHHLFLTRYGCYLVVFNMENICNEDGAIRKKSLNFIRFWLNSIGLHAVKKRNETNNTNIDPGSPVIIIGTHKDIIKDAAQHSQINEILKTELDHELKQIFLVNNNTENLNFFPVDNTNPSDANIINMRKQVEEKIKAEKYLNVEYPITWMNVLDKLKKISSNEEYEDNFVSECDLDFVQLDRVEEIAEHCGVSRQNTSTKKWEEVQVMLQRFHELGVIVYFNDIPVLSNHIILNPQWIVDRISDVIRSYNASNFTHSKAIDNLAKKMKFDWDNLTNHGILNRRLLRHLWRGYGGHIKFLLHLMQSFALITPFRVPSKGAMLLEYLVPSILLETKCPFVKNKLLFSLKFQYVLPKGFFDRLNVIMLEAEIEMKLKRKGKKRDAITNAKMQDKQVSAVIDDGNKSHDVHKLITDMKIYKNWSIINFGLGERFGVMKNDKTIQFYQIDGMNENVGAQVQMKILRMLSRLNNDFYNGKLYKSNISVDPNYVEEEDLSNIEPWPRVEIKHNVSNVARPYITESGRTKGYYFEPKSISTMTNNDLKHVEKFVVGRHDENDKLIGKVEWNQPVDLTKVGAIDDIVCIENGIVNMYELHENEPKNGTELNCAAILHFEDIWPKKGREDSKALLRFEKRLKKQGKKKGYTNVSYDSKKGIYRCKVEHFTGQGSNSVDEDLVDWILKVLWRKKHRKHNKGAAHEFAQGLCNQGVYLEDIIGDENDEDEPEPPAADPLTRDNLASIGMKPNHVKKIVRHLFKFFTDKIENEKNELFMECTVHLEHYRTWVDEFGEEIKSSPKQKNRRMLKRLDTEKDLNEVEKAKIQLVKAEAKVRRDREAQEKGRDNSIKQIIQNQDNMTNLMLTLHSNEFPKYVLLIPDDKKNDDEGTGILSKINNIFTKAKADVLKKIKLMQYWRLVVLDEGPLLDKFKPKKDDDDDRCYIHKGIQFELPGDNLKAIIPALNFLSQMIKIATVVTGFPIDLKKTFDTLTGVDTTDMCNFYCQLEVDNKDKMEINDGENKFHKSKLSKVEEIQQEMENDNTLTEDQALQKVFWTNHEKLKDVIDTLCKGWLVKLENSGLKRIYTEDGDVHYVSSFYYEQVDRIDGYRKAK